MHFVEFERFLVQLGFPADALELPGRDVAEVGVVAQRLAVGRLTFFAEVSAARFLALQRVEREQFGRDGLSARDLVLEAGPPDLVVTDESTPRMSGHDFARRLLARHAGVKVLYLTGYADAFRADRKDVGENEGYVGKPCTVRGLLQAVSLLLFRRLEARPTSRPSRSL